MGWGSAAATVLHIVLEREREREAPYLRSACVSLSRLVGAKLVVSKQAE